MAGDLQEAHLAEGAVDVGGHLPATGRVRGVPGGEIDQRDGGHRLPLRSGPAEPRDRSLPPDDDAVTVLQGSPVTASSTIRLVPFEPELLPRVLPWFDHPEVQRRLGGRSWPERELVLRNAARGEEFRGRRVLRSHTYVAVDDAGARSP